MSRNSKIERKVALRVIKLVESLPPNCAAQVAAVNRPQV